MVIGTKRFKIQIYSIYKCFFWEHIASNWQVYNRPQLKKLVEVRPSSLQRLCKDLDNLKDARDILKQPRRCHGNSRLPPGECHVRADITSQIFCSIWRGESCSVSNAPPAAPPSAAAAIWKRKHGGDAAKLTPAHLCISTQKHLKHKCLIHMRKQGNTLKTGAYKEFLPQWQIFCQ